MPAYFLHPIVAPPVDPISLLVLGDCLQTLFEFHDRGAGELTRSGKVRFQNMCGVFAAMPRDGGYLRHSTSGLRQHGNGHSLQIMEVQIGDASRDGSSMPMSVEVSFGPGTALGVVIMTTPFRSMPSSIAFRPFVHLIDTTFLPLDCRTVMLVAVVAGPSQPSQIALTLASVHPNHQRDLRLSGTHFQEGIYMRRHLKLVSTIRLIDSRKILEHVAINLASVEGPRAQAGESGHEIVGLTVAPAWPARAVSGR